MKCQNLFPRKTRKKNYFSVSSDDFFTIHGKPHSSSQVYICTLTNYDSHITKTCL